MYTAAYKNSLASDSNWYYASLNCLPLGRYVYAKKYAEML